MCGIAGVLSLGESNPPSQGLLEAMVRQLAHRGPDGVGFYRDGPVGLAHARLSIIDLQSGAQPIHNEDRNVWVVFNGEIFNYIELRAELESAGHRFYTHSDTEVLVHLYERDGDRFVDKLNGQFSIALWDQTARRLVLVRDRAGITPLFYANQAGSLIFASEAKAILPALGAAPSLNPQALDDILTFWVPLSPETIFKEIVEVSPGEMVVVDNGQVARRRYWDFTYPPNGDYRTEAESRLAEELHALLVDATKVRLRADVPVGAYLSGGLDSSVLTSLIHHHGGVPLRTFSIGFSDESLDETPHQRLMIDHLHADHSSIHCTQEQIGNAFLDTVWHTETPVVRTAPVPMQLLSGLVQRQRYKVVLTGEGADEVFGGYDLFKESKIRSFWARHATSSLRPLLLKRLYPYLELSPGRAQSYLKTFFGQALDTPELAHFSHIPRWSTTSMCKEFFSKSLKVQLDRDPIARLTSSLPQSIHQWHPFNRAQYLESKLLLPGYLLSSQGDRMLMSHSVEGRFPFLDHRVIDFASHLHPKLKMKVLNEKYLLKMAAKRYLPPAIVERYKQPYRAPDIPAFFGERTPEYVAELLSPRKLAEYGYFDPAKVELLVKKIQNKRAIGFKDNMALVAILSTHCWHYHFIERYRANFFRQP
jgi:asparagine synthase (glutamine-hydrolysing)